MKLCKAAYGLPEATIVWYKYLLSVLLRRGWVLLDCDQSLAMLHDASGKILGPCSIHVDGQLVCGESMYNGTRQGKPAKFDEVTATVEKDISFGVRRYDQPTYTGCQVSQAPPQRSDIAVHQEPYIDGVEPLSSKGRCRAVASTQGFDRIHGPMFSHDPMWPMMLAMCLVLASTVGCRTLLWPTRCSCT